MGLTPGTKVTVVNSAPFHGPLEVYVRGSRLAIGRGMAERIFVETQRPHDRDSAEGSTFLKAHTNGEGDSAEG